MSDTVNSALETLRQEHRRLTEAIAALERLDGSPTTNPKKRRWTMSAEARAKIAAAQRARWAKQKRRAS